MQHGADVALLGWDHDMQVGALSDSLQSSGDERQLVTDYFDAGCDVLFPVTRTINLGLASMAQDYELAVIGTDVDWFCHRTRVWGNLANLRTEESRSGYV